MSDIHGNVIERFSYKKSPELRQLDDTDVVVVCGDIGIMWPGYEKEAKYVLNWLTTKPYSIIFIRGNHDVEPWWESCPASNGNTSITLLDGDLRIAAINGKTYDNVYLVTSSAILSICEKKCLCIGGAESTDAYNLFYPHEKEKIKIAKSQGKWFRVIGKSWWPGEGINLAYLKALLSRSYFNDFCHKFDYVFSHQSPAGYCFSPHNYRKDRRVPNEEQRFLEDLRLRQSFSFKRWIHAHQHQVITWTKEDEAPVSCVYFDFIDVDNWEWLE